MDDIAVATRTAAWLSADGKPTPPCTLDQTLRAILRSGSAFAPAATRVVLEATGS